MLSRVRGKHQPLVINNSYFHLTMTFERFALVRGPARHQF